MSTFQVVAAQEVRRMPPKDNRRFIPEDRGYNTPCWIWQGKIAVTGYGMRYMGEDIEELAHRVYYEWFVGPIPRGLTIDHLCRVRACVNPAHMEPVTRGENVRRGDHSKKLTPAQVERIRLGESRQLLAREFGVTPEAIDYHRRRAV
jgi:hypothetical protein